MKNCIKNKIIENKKGILISIACAILFFSMIGVVYEYGSKTKDILYYDETKFQIKDIVKASLYYVNDNNYIEVTVLDEETMNDNDYVLEVYLENGEILRYDVEKINYGDDFVIDATYEGTSEYAEMSDAQVIFSMLDIESNISLLSLSDDIELYETNGKIEVSSYEEFLLALESDLNSDIVLINDIDFGGYVSSSGYIVSGNFTGSINGGNYAILNLSNTLFETVSDATIENLLIKDAFISGAVRSILAANLENSEISNVHINGSVLRASANNGIGPFAGTVTSSNLSNISVTDTIIGGQRFLGGLFGLSYGDTYIDNAYVATDIRHYETYAAGIVTLGYNDSSVNITNSIINVVLDTSDALYKGGIYGAGASGNLDGVLVNLTTDIDSINKIGETTLYSGSVTSSGSGVYTVIESGGTSSGFDFEQQVSISNLNKNFYANLGLESNYWDYENLVNGMPTLKSYTKVVETYLEKESPESSFINVSTAEELITAIASDNSANINLTDNINFLLYDGYTSAMIMDTYSGILNGNGYAMLNLSVALFDAVDGATFNDLLISNAIVSGRTAIFAGALKNAKLNSVHITESYLYSTNSSSGVGAFAAAMTSVIMDDVSITNSTINATKRSGGIAGYSYGTSFLSNIYIDDKTIVTNDSDATGGLIGQNSAYIYMKNAVIAPVFNSNGSSNRAGLIGYSTGALQFVDVFVAATSTSSDSIANSIPILHGYSASISGSMYEWSESNLKLQYNASYSALAEDSDVNSSFYIDTLHFDNTVWNINNSTLSNNFPTLYTLDSMIDKYNSNFENVTDLFKTVDEYDALIKEKYTLSEDAILTKEVEYLALLRNLVNNVGYNHMLAYLTAGNDEKEFAEWLLEYENVKMYTEAGEPDGGSYTESIRILYQIYTKYKDELINYDDTGKGITYSELYRKMMFTVSHTHATTVGLWVSKSSVATDPNNSTGLGRYEIYRRMVLADLELDDYQPETSTSISILDDIFYNLEMEEMRYVMNGIIDDESVEWLEWYVRTKKNDARGGYSLLSYTFGYDYTLEKYYTDEDYWDGIYGFKKFGMTYSQSYPKQWSVFEEGGVCGAISKSAVNAQTVNGKPATVVSQPGHAAYTYLKTASNGDYYWGYVDTSLATWAYTGKTEKLWTRMPNGWGNDSVVTGYAASYLFISQAALNDYDNYIESEMELLLIDVYEGNYDYLETIYFNSIDKLDFNLDAWLGLARLYVADGRSDEEKYELLEKMTEALKYQPLPLYHTANIIISTMTDSVISLKVANLMSDTYTAASVATSSDTLEYSGVAQVGAYLLGAATTEVATFSFDGSDANKIILDDQYKDSEIVWFASVDGGNTWIEAEGISLLLTDEQLSLITEDDDIRIYFSGSDGSNLENQYIIDITTSTSPAFSTYSNTSNLFANDYENKVIGGPDTNMTVIQWYDSVSKTWKWIEQELPDLSGDTMIEVRVGPNETKLASGSAFANFTTDTDTEKRKYVTIDRLSIEDYSSLYSTSYAKYAVDGTTNTMYHSSAQSNNYITIKVDNPIYLSGFQYTPRLDSSSNGVIYEGNIYTSLDNETWTLLRSVVWDTNRSTKIESFDEPVIAKYIKLEATSSGGNFLSTTMINLFEDLTLIDDVSLEYSITENTNKSVEATLVGENITILNNGGSNKYTFKENGTFTFEYSGIDGVTRTITATVNNIDTELPIADIKYVTENGYVTASLINESEDITVINNSGSTEYLFKENGTFTFIIEDSVGNRNEVEAEVRNILFSTIMIDDEVYGSSTSYSKDIPFILNSITLNENTLNLSLKEYLVSDIEIYHNNQVTTNYEMKIELITSTDDYYRYLIEITNEAGFTSYFYRIIYIDDITVNETDKEELQSLVNDSNKIDTTKYTEESIYDLTVAIQNAINILNNENATQEEIDNVVKLLNLAIESLEVIELSSDSQLSKIEIVGYTLSPVFNKDTYVFSVSVGDINNFDKIIIETSDSNSKYVITGNSNFVTGKNTIIIKVTAEDGESVSTYTINVNKIVEEETDEPTVEDDLTGDESNNNNDNSNSNSTDTGSTDSNDDDITNGNSSNNDVTDNNSSNNSASNGNNSSSNSTTSGSTTDNFASNNSTLPDEEDEEETNEDLDYNELVDDLEEELETESQAEENQYNDIDAEIEEKNYNRIFTVVTVFIASMVILILLKNKNKDK